MARPSGRGRRGNGASAYGAVYGDGYTAHQPMQTYGTDGYGAMYTGGYDAPQAMQMCCKCGRTTHENMLQCPANARWCIICQRHGHFARVCRAASRGRYDAGPSNRGRPNYF